jgi:hypothetical protein
MKGDDAQTHEEALKRAVRKLRLSARRLQAAQAERDHLIRRSKDALPRRRVAELTEMTPGRVQQIIDVDGPRS